MYRRVEGFLLLFASISSFIVLFTLSPIIALFLSVDFDVFAKTWINGGILTLEAWNSLLLTFEAATISSSILLLTESLLAYILTRYNFPGKTFIEGLIDIPLMIPHSVAGIMLILAYGRDGLYGGLVKALGITVVDSFWGVVAAMTFVSTPLMLNTLKLGYESIDVTLEYVARSLGATRWTAFKKVTLPLLAPSMVTGFLLSWARAVSEVGAILIIAYYPKTINILVYEWFNTYGLKYAVSLSVVLVLFSLMAFILLRMVREK